MKRKGITYRFWINLFFVIFCLMFIVPFLFVIAVSFTNEDVLLKYGYHLVPKKFDLTAYKYVFKNPQKIIDAYAVTMFQSFFGTLLSIIVMALCAYPLSRPNFKYKRPITFYIFFTMLFSGGLVPTYILLTKYLHLGDKVWIYVLNALAVPFYIIIFRTFFQKLPSSLVESAKIDGASELRVFFQIILPLSKPVLATISLFVLLDRWNNWYTALIYIRNERLYTLQYLLQRILREAEFINNMARDLPAGITIETDTPTESMRFAMCIVAAGPMLVVFPFFQKYFTKGMTVGAIKG